MKVEEALQVLAEALSSDSRYQGGTKDLDAAIGEFERVCDYFDSREA